MASAVNFALSDSRQLQLTELNELLNHAKEITEQFDDLVNKPVEFKTCRLEELKAMRAFCLALSKRSVRGRADRKPEHPFRR